MAQRFFDTVARRGFVVEGEYRGANERYGFTCSRGHRWETRGQRVVDGTGCPQCMVQSRSERLLRADGLERLHAAAAARGGRCLATAYDGVSAGYTWECAQGHRWNSEGARVLAGVWCAICAVQRRGELRRLADGLERLRAAAVAQGGVCLAEAYGMLDEKYRFRCAKGHEWKARGHLILRGTWCMKCLSESKRLGIERMREVAHARGGRCLSEVYLGIKVKLAWQCHLGHVWDTTPAMVLSKDAWCPFCFRLRITKSPVKRAKYGG